MAGLAGALGATLSSLCCILPLAIILFGLGSGAFMAVTMEYQAIFIPVGALSLAMGYRAYFAERRRCAELRCRLAGGRLTLAVLILSTIVVGTAAALVLLPAVTADLLAWAVGRSGSGGMPMGQ